jgi:hypothetical protein
MHVLLAFSFIVLLLDSCADDDMTIRALRPHPPLVIRQAVCADACSAPDIQFSFMHVLLPFTALLYFYWIAVQMTT